MEKQQLIEHTQKSIYHAFYNQSKITPEILAMQGMTGDKTRHLYNNICDLPGATYLEIGTWRGSSFISAMYKNTNTFGISVDNWSEFNGGREDFHANIRRFLTNGEQTLNHDKDCWTVDKNDLPRPIDIFMYDGWHSYETQKKAITYYHQFFSKYVIIMVDDWACDWVDVKRGTMDGLAECKLNILFQHEIGLVNTNQHHFGGDTFWNGCGIFVCERTDI